MNNQQEMKRYEEDMLGFKIHAGVTIFVLAILFIVNLIFVPEFLWAIFPLIGMTLGLSMHYLFGVKANEPKHTVNY
jgi:hypothetical protein